MLRLRFETSCTRTSLRRRTLDQSLCGWLTRGKSVPPVSGGAGLAESDVLLGFSDHGPAIRKGLRLLGLALIGCGAHGIQLSLKHSLPHLKEPKSRPSTASDSDDSSSSSSSSSFSSSPAAAQQPSAPKKNEKQLALRRKLTPSFQRYRSIAKHFAAYDDQYNWLVEDAESSGLPVVAFQYETPTRWSSCLNQLISVIQNNRAMNLSRTLLATCLLPSVGTSARVLWNSNNIC